MITWELANKIRSIGGVLPVNEEYCCEELKRIAVAQQQSMQLFDECDRLITTKANEKENEKVSIRTNE